MTAPPTVRESIVQLGMESLRPQGMRALLGHARVATARELTDKARRVQQLPPRLQFRLRGFAEHESTDDTLQGASDEVFLSALGLDSAAVVYGPDGEPVTGLAEGSPIGDISADDVRGPWRNAPHVLLDFDVRRPSDWPRTFNVILMFVEHDNDDLAGIFADLNEQVGAAGKTAVEKAASVAAAATVGAAIGTAIPIPGVGTAVGAAVGALAGLAYDEIIEVIASGLDNEVFTPLSVEIMAPGPDELRQHPEVGVSRTLEVHEHGAHYALEYEWTLVG